MGRDRMTDKLAEPIESAEPSEDAKPARAPFPLRTKLLLGLLALMSVTFGVNAAHVYTLENELQVIADEKEAALSLDPVHPRPLETASIVTATKEYLIYGKVNGKIEIYIKQRGNGDRLTGVDYFFSRDGVDWIETESGMCTDKECQIRGAKAFAND